MPFRAIADAELNSEIDAQAYEQRHKGNRDDAEHADDKKAGRYRQNEPGKERHQDAEDDAERLNREPQGERDRGDHQCAYQSGAFRERRVFFRPAEKRDR